MKLTQALGGLGPVGPLAMDFGKEPGLSMCGADEKQSSRLCEKPMTKSYPCT